MLIPFPITFFVSTFVCDLVYWRTASDAWGQATLWLLGAGLIMAALAAVMGLIDVLSDIQIRNLSDAWLHAGGNVIVVLVELYNWYSRYEHGNAAIIPVGLVLSLIAVLILLFTGWKGWEMVYRHRVGIADTLQKYGPVERRRVSLDFGRSQSSIVPACLSSSRSPLPAGSVAVSRSGGPPDEF